MGSGLWVKTRSHRRKLVDCPFVDRLNIGPIPTNRLTWDQPHEGNLFEHLFGRRAYQEIAA